MHPRDMNFFKHLTKKHLPAVILITLVIGFAVGYFAFQGFAQTGPFAPGAELDPGCEPGETGCVVEIPTGGASMGDTIGNSPTDGSVLFVGTSGILEQDNTNLFWDDANNRLGLVTSTPSQSLDVAGSINALGAYYLEADRILHGGNTVNESIYLGKNAGAVSTSDNVSNVGVGSSALNAIADGGAGSGQRNVAVGSGALMSLNDPTLVGAVSNTATGWNAGQNMTTGYQNTLVGSAAGQNITTGTNNVLLGRGAGIGITSGTALTTGGSNVLIGQAADVSDATLSNAIAIGNGAVVSASNSMVLGSGVNVGIGTGSPAAKLHVVGTIGNSPLRVDTDSLDNALLVTSDGQAQINQTSNTFNYDLVIENTSAGNSAASSILLTNDGAGGLELGILGNGNSVFATYGSGNDTFIRGNNSAGNLNIINKTNSIKFFSQVDASDIATMVINGSNVGIGTSSPSTALEVDGIITTAISSASNLGTINFYNSSTASGNGKWQISPETSPVGLSFFDNGVVRMRLFKDGDVLALYSVATQALLQLTATTDTWQIGSNITGAEGQDKFSFRHTPGGEIPLTITKTSLVGIGTTNPGAALSVVGLSTTNPGTSQGMVCITTAGDLWIDDGPVFNCDDTD